MAMKWLGLAPQRQLHSDECPAMDIDRGVMIMASRRDLAVFGHRGWHRFVMKVAIFQNTLFEVNCQNFDS